MSMPVMEKIREFLFNPSHAFRRIRNEEPGEAFRYLVILTVFSAVMATVMTALEIFHHPLTGISSSQGSTAADPLLLVTEIIALVVITLVTVVCFGLWLHVWVYLSGGRKGVWQTEKGVFYSFTPFLILAWIPVIGILVGTIWTVIITVIGIKELQRLSGIRAALSVICAVIIAVFIAALLLGAVFLAVISTLPITT